MFEPAAALAALLVVVTCTKAATHVSNPQARGVASAGAGEPITPPIGLDAPAKSAPNQARGSPSAGPSAAPLPSSPQHGNLARLRLALDGFESGVRRVPLRILWFGDSHTAADYLPNAIRKQLSRRVLLGGPGYVSLGIPNFRHGLARVWSEGSIEVVPHPPARRTTEDDGVFGLGGTRASMRDSSAFVTARAVIGGPAIPMTFELVYRLSSESDALRVTAGDQRIEITSKSTAPAEAGLRWERLAVSSDITLEIRALRGRPQLLGVIMETEQPGLVIDTLGVNGARFGTFLAWQEQSLALQIVRRQPVAFVVAYGTNEVFDPEPVERHASKLAQVVERIRRAASDAECIVVGPTDAGKGGDSTRARVVAMDAAEHATADRLGCSYFSSYEVMASEGGFDAWARQDPPLALSDGVHLSARGYTRLGEAMYMQVFK